MFEENFDYDISELEQKPETFAKFTAGNAEGHYLFDEEGGKYLDLTSNDDYLPLGYFKKNNAGGFYETQTIRSKNSLILEKLIKESIGFENSRFFAEKQSAYNFVKKIINKKPEKSVLVCSSEADNFVFADKEVINIPLNDVSAVKTFLNKKTEAVAVEISQVKNSFSIAEADYLTLLREYCDKNNAMLVYDVSSISSLRLSRGLFNFEDSVKPDVIISSRGLTAGSSLYIVSFNTDTPDSGACGIYSCAYAEAIEFIQNQDDYKALITENSKYIEEKFRELAEVHIGLADFISCGMMFAAVTEIPAEKLAEEALSKGVFLKPLNEYSILLCPPYNITKEEIDRVIEVFNELFNELTQHDRLIVY